VKSNRHPTGKTGTIVYAVARLHEKNRKDLVLPVFFFCAIIIRNGLTKPHAREPVTWNTTTPPQEKRIIAIVRRWLAEGDGFNISFIAGNPMEHLQAVDAVGLGQKLDFAPTMDVIGAMICRVDGMLQCVCCDGSEECIPMDAILCWHEFPDDHQIANASEEAVALISRAADAARQVT